MEKNTALKFWTDHAEGIIRLSIDAGMLLLPPTLKAAVDEEDQETHVLFQRRFDPQRNVSWVLVASEHRSGEPLVPVDTEIVEADDEADHILVRLPAAVELSFIDDLFGPAKQSDDQQKLIRILISNESSIRFKFN